MIHLRKTSFLFCCERLYFNIFVKITSTKHLSCKKQRRKKMKCFIQECYWVCQHKFTWRKRETILSCCKHKLRTVQTCPQIKISFFCSVSPRSLHYLHMASYNDSVSSANRVWRYIDRLLSQRHYRSSPVLVAYRIWQPILHFTRN